MSSSLSFANSLYLRFLGKNATNEQRQVLSQAIKAAVDEAGASGYSTFNATVDFVNQHTDVIAPHIVNYYQHFSQTPTLSELTAWADSTGLDAHQVTDLMGLMVYDVYALSVNNQPSPLRFSSGSAIDVLVAENSQPDLMVKTSGVNSEFVRYNIVKDKGDGRLFTIDPKTGVLNFSGNHTADFEAADRQDHTFNVTVVATNTETQVDQFQTITLKVTDVNEPPQWVVPDLPLSAPENSVTPFYTLQASDPENDPLSFTINNTVDKDNGLFKINPQGELSFIKPQNFGTANNRVYQVDVAVSDGVNPAVIQTLGVSVKNPNESVLPTLALTAVNGDSSLTVSEGEIAHYAVKLVSGSIKAGETLSFTLTANNGTAVNPADFSDLLIDPNIVANPYIFKHTFKQSVAAGSQILPFQLTINPDNQVEAQEQFSLTLSGANLNNANTVKVNTQGGPFITVINDATPTYTVTSSVANVNEGARVKFDLATTHIANATVLNYTLGGTINAADIIDTNADGDNNPLTGQLTVDAKGTATVAIGLTADALTEGVENLLFNVKGSQAVVVVNDTSTNILPTYQVSSAVTRVDEGGVVKFNLATTQVANATVLNYTLGGTINAADIIDTNADGDNNPLTGQLTVDAKGTATVAIGLTADALTEGAENLLFTVKGSQAVVVVNDTSTNIPPTYQVSSAVTRVDEGGVVKFNLATTQVANATVLNYTLGGTINAADIIDTNADGDNNPLTGQLTVDAKGTATVAIGLTADALTEGTENLVFTVKGQQTAVLVNDTSLTNGPIIVNVNADGAHDASANDVTYVVSAGSYSYVINGFNTGDHFKLFSNASITVLPDNDQTDGVQSIQLADVATSTVATIILTGLSPTQDAGVFNQASIDAVFGAGTIG